MSWAQLLGWYSLLSLSLWVSNSGVIEKVVSHINSKTIVNLLMHLEPAKNTLKTPITSARRIFSLNWSHLAWLKGLTNWLTDCVSEQPRWPIRKWKTIAIAVVVVVKTSSDLFPLQHFLILILIAGKILGKFHVAAATKWNCLLFGVFIEKNQPRPLPSHKRRWRWRRWRWAWALA